MTIGREEDVGVVDQTRNHYKLWNRIDAKNLRAQQSTEAEMQRYRKIIADSDNLLFPGLGDFVEQGGEGHCDACMYRASYGAETTHRFGGVELCQPCRAYWREYLLSFPERAAAVFPELVPVYGRAIQDVGEPKTAPETSTKPTSATAEAANIVSDGSKRRDSPMMSDADSSFAPIELSAQQTPLAPVAVPVVA